MKFLIDAQLPLALTSWLQHQGYAASHVAELGMVVAPDVDLADHAEATGAIIISKDADFITLRLPDRFALVWLRCGNATNRALRLWLEPRWPQVVRLLADGERFVEVR